MKFDFIKYGDLIYNYEFDKAKEYRINNVPQKIYKYISLNDNVSEENKKRLDTLENKLLYMTTYKSFNDPFELKTCYLNKDALENAGWKTEALEIFLECIRQSYLISCFTSDLENNMPMWAHYANNHQGFCIEYIVKDYEYLYPVSYESKRIAIASIITNLISKLKDFNKKLISKEDPDFILYHTIFDTMGVMKDKSWEYENEIRLIYLKNEIELDHQPIKISDIGLDVGGIYIGAKCSEKNKDRLLNIASKLKCNAYQMYFDEYEPCYRLKFKPIS